MLSEYNDLAREISFPEIWKCSKLVLLRKENKPPEDPSSYRHICLLDVESQLFEQLIARLKRELDRTEELSEKQYGFREERQTVDAVNEVLQGSSSILTPTQKTMYGDYARCKKCV